MKNCIRKNELTDNNLEKLLESIKKIILIVA